MDSLDMRLFHANARYLLARARKLERELEE